ncbi:MAG: acetyltransferase component of pyruvate dehydrogenase complex [Candidatus Hydrogenedentota bacterium]
MHEVKLPQLGQSVEEASIVQWLKAEGDTVKQGEPLLTVQTDKAEIECEAPASGTLRKILVEPDVTVPVLSVIALLGEPNEPLPDLSKYAGETTGTAPVEAAPSAREKLATVAPSSASAPAAMPGPSTAVSPRARQRAASLHINPAIVSGSGIGGRVMECDVLAYAERIKSLKITPTAMRLAEEKGIDVTLVQGTGPGGRITKADIERSPRPAAAASGTRRVPLSPMRRVIAKRMSESKFSAPHYYMTVEVDMSNAARFRAAQPWKPSYNDIVMAAASEALRQFPEVNARWAGDAVEEMADINMGFAVALPTGLIVPVVRQTQTKSLQDISRECKTLTERARTGKLTPDDYSGNTFTVSNLGGFGVDHFTAIINQPDSAILAVGQIKDRPVVIDGGIHIRPIMKLTLSSDHRVIDGALAARFMGRLKDVLERAAF